MGVNPKIGGKPPKWMVKIIGKPYEQMDDLVVFPYSWKHPYGEYPIFHRASKGFKKSTFQEIGPFLKRSPFQKPEYLTHRIHVWYIYLHLP